MNASKTTQMAAGMTTGSVVSSDGTRIGYLRAGHGPAVVLLHGSNKSARSHTQFALALADAFTVYLPDRRGRGLSGPHRPDHGMRTEVEDLQAVVAGSGAQKVFGAEAEASNKRVSVFATTPCNHVQILNKAPDTVVAAIAPPGAAGQLGPIGRADAREVGHLGRLVRAGSGRRHRSHHRGDRYRTPDPGRVVPRRHDCGAIRGTAPQAGRWAGAHRRRLPDRHVRRGGEGEGPRAVPPAGVDRHRARRDRGADINRIAQRVQPHRQDHHLLTDS